MFLLFAAFLREKENTFVYFCTTLHYILLISDFQFYVHDLQLNTRVWNAAEEQC